MHEDSLIGLVDVVNRENGEITVVTRVAQGDTRSSLEACLVNCFLGRIESDGHRKKVAIGETRFSDDTKKAPPLAKHSTYLRIFLCELHYVCSEIFSKTTPRSVGRANCAGYVEGKRTHRSPFGSRNLRRISQ